VGVLALAIVALLIMLIRTRGKIGQMARRVASNTTGVLKGITKRLGALPEQAPGKLVVLQGANMGREFRLASPVIKVGRDPQFCDLALHDDFVSNPHFTIRLEQTQFYIIDEGSTNGTRLNGVTIAPQQRTLLQPDAIIEVGSTRLQFKRLGGTTRHLGRGSSRTPSVPQVPQAPPAAPSHPPAEPQGMVPSGQARRMPPPPPAALPPQPPPEPARGGPTVRLPDEEPQSERRGGPTVKLQGEEPKPERRGGPTVKLQGEEPKPERRGGPTVKLRDEESEIGQRGGPTVKLRDEEPQYVQRGGPPAGLPDEEPEAGQKGGPTVKLPDEESQEQ
jgi:pSer/pThr/pTyr-binding forkhead associated (FHA) protein